MRLRSSRAWRAGLLLAALLLALAHASGVMPLPAIAQLDLAIDDLRLRATMPRSRDERIVIVDVDERSLAEVGRWPWRRDRLAAMVDELFVRQKIGTLGFDMVFAEPDPSGGLDLIAPLAARDAALAARLEAWRADLDTDARLARSLAGRPVVLGYYLTQDREARRVGELPAPVFDAALPGAREGGYTLWSGYAANLASLAQAAQTAGFFNFLPDGDGLVRSVPLVAEVDGRHHDTLALAMMRVHAGHPELVPVRPEGARAGVAGLAALELRQGAVRTRIRVDERVAARVPFRGPGWPAGGSFEYVSAADVLAGRLAAGQLAGKLVIVGSTAPGLYDLRATPVSDVYPGVEVHANLLAGLLDGRIPVRPDWARGFEATQLVAVTLLLGMALPRLRAAGAMLASAALALALVVANAGFYLARHEVLPLASALLLVVMTFIVTTSWGYLVETGRRRSLARLFGTYVPPELVERMARDPKPYDMRAENRELTILFCDMRNFTRVSESLPPEELRALVNRFFSTMTDAIRAHRGTLDKYIGDAIMAFWGAPLADAEHAANAVRAALAMCERLVPLNAELQARGLPSIGLGLGLNTGLVCVGDMGSNIRRSYTVMGDAVNLASRIEALTRHYGVDLLVGAATREAAGDGFAWVEVDRVRVKGKQQVVTLFTPAPGAIARSEGFAEEMRIWRLALDSYRLQHWDAAQARVAELLSRFGTSPYRGLHTQLAERIDFHRSTPPPPGWDGAHTFDSK